MKLCSRLLFFSYILNVFDLLATASLVAKFGAGIEGNPMGVMLLSDPRYAVVYKVFVIAALMFLIYAFRRHKAARIGTYAVFCAYLMLGIYHCWIIGTLS